MISNVRINAEESAIESKIAPDSTNLEKQPESKLPEEVATTPSNPQPPAITTPAQSEPPATAPKAAHRIKIATKFILTDFKPGLSEPMSKEGRFTITSLLSDQQEQLFMRGLAQKRGTYLCTAPSVTSRSGEPVLVEIIRQIPGTPEQVARRGPKSEIPFVGISLRFTPRFSEELPRPVPNNSPELVPSAGMMELEQSVDYRFAPGIYQPLVANNAEPSEKLNPEKIKTIKRSINGRIPSGFTVCSDLGEIQPGKFLTAFTRVDAIDVEGRLLYENGKLAPDDSNRNEATPTSGRNVFRGSEVPPEALPSPRVKGKLRLNAVLVETPLRTPRPPGEGLVIGLTPSDPELATIIKNYPRAKVRKLKAAEMRLNKEGTPWPEFPGLIVSATASKDFKLISIASHAFGNGSGQFPNLWEEMPSGSTMNFGIKSDDVAFERRLLITIEAMK